MFFALKQAISRCCNNVISLFHSFERTFQVPWFFVITIIEILRRLSKLEEPVRHINIFNSQECRSLMLKLDSLWANSVVFLRSFLAFWECEKKMMCNESNRNRSFKLQNMHLYSKQSSIFSYQAIKLRHNSWVEKFCFLKKKFWNSNFPSGLYK